MFRSLRHRNFRLYYFGQLVSLNGSWMQNVAQAWLVYELTHSSLMLGVVSFFGLLPVLLFGLFGGVLADRWPRHRLMAGVQGIAMAQAFALAALTLSGAVQAWHVVALAFLLGLVHAVEIPARHSLVAELVPREDLPNAIALSSSIFNTARFVGPPIAGWMVAWIGEGMVFAINGVSFLAVLFALLAMKLPRADSMPHTASPFARLAEGLGYARRHPHIRAGLMMLAMVSMVGTASVLMPVFARDVFGGGSENLGLLLGAVGIGALGGALKLARRTSAVGLDRLIGMAGIAGGMGIMVFSFVEIFWAALPVLVLVGFTQSTMAASINTLIQLLVPDVLRGRVMSLFSVIFIGLMPAGGLAAGALAQIIGAPLTVTVFGLAGVAASSLFLWRAPRLAEGEVS